MSRIDTKVDLSNCAGDQSFVDQCTIHALYFVEVSKNFFAYLPLQYSLVSDLSIIY